MKTTVELKIPIEFKDDYKSYIKKVYKYCPYHIINEITSVKCVSMQKLIQTDFYNPKIAATFEIHFKGHYIPVGYTVNLKDIKYKVINNTMKNKQTVELKDFGCQAYLINN